MTPPTPSTASVEAVRAVLDVALLLDQQLAQARAEERERLIAVFAQWLNDVAPLKGNGERASGLIERIKALS